MINIYRSCDPDRACLLPPHSDRLAENDLARFVVPAVRDLRSISPKRVYSSDAVRSLRVDDVLADGVAGQFDAAVDP